MTLHPITRDALKLALSAGVLTHDEARYVLTRARGDGEVLAVLCDVAALAGHGARARLCGMNDAWHALCGRGEE